MLPLYKSLDLESLQDCITRLLKKVAQDDSAILTLFCYISAPPASADTRSPNQMKIHVMLSYPLHTSFLGTCSTSYDV